MSIEANGLEHMPKMIKGMTKAEYHRLYMREWARRTKDFNIQPTKTRKFKLYYEEYKTIKQQESEHVCSFTEFLLHYAEVGYLNWRTKVKGK